MGEQETVEHPDVKIEDQEAVNQNEVDEKAEDSATEKAEDPAADDEIVVSIGDEQQQEDHEQAPEWVRDLRKKNREDQRRIRELEEQLKAKSADEKPASLGKKPTLEDYDYDAEKFEQELALWYDRKRKHDEAAAKAEEAAKSAQSAWQAKLESYGTAKSQLKVKDFEDAETTVQDSLSVTQQSIVIQGAENTALLVYALGKNPARAKELGSITDPVKFAFAVAKLEAQLKVTNKKTPPPPPEKAITGSGGSSSSVDSTLNRLRAEAEKTGDYTKVTAYKRQKKAA